MNLVTLALLAAGGFAAVKLKQKADAEKVAAQTQQAAATTPVQPIMDTTNTVTSIQRTVNDNGADSDDPTLSEMNYGVVTGWGPSWGSYGRPNMGTYGGRSPRGMGGGRHRRMGHRR